MKRIIGLVLASATLAAVALPVQAKSRPSGGARVETIEDILANSRDPSGNYRGYPNWARAAFGGGGGGR